MINQPAYGTQEYYAYKNDELKDQDRAFDYQKEALRLQQDHELAMKTLEVKQTQAEVSLKATLRVLIQVPLVVLTILPITAMVLLKRPVPSQLWKLLEIK